VKSISATGNASRCNFRNEPIKWISIGSYGPNGVTPRGHISLSVCYFPDSHSWRWTAATRKAPAISRAHEIIAGCRGRDVEGHRCCSDDCHKSVAHIISYLRCRARCFKTAPILKRRLRTPHAAEVSQEWSLHCERCSVCSLALKLPAWLASRAKRSNA
jgi:hypothetical protein